MKHPTNTSKPYCLERWRGGDLAQGLPVEPAIQQLDGMFTEFCAKKIPEQLQHFVMKGVIQLNNVAPAGAPGGIQIEAIADVFSLNDSNPELDKALTEVLSAKQVRRVKQISLQAKGPASLLDRRVIRALGLTAEQEDNIEAAIPAEPNGKIQVNGVVRDPIAEKRDAAWTATLEMLTKEQRAKWDAMVGDMLPTAELRKISQTGQGGFGVQAFGNLMPGVPFPPFPPVPPVPPQPIPNRDD